MNDANTSMSRRRRRSLSARSGAAAALAVILLLSLTACGKSRSPAASDPGSTSQAVSSAQPDAPEAAPGGEVPAGEEPAGEEPAGEEPAGEEPAGEEPAGEEPAGEEPAGESSDHADEYWKAEFEKSLLENYGVTPEYYEDLGGGVYQVYVKIDGKDVPYVAVDSATGDYHG